MSDRQIHPTRPATSMPIHHGRRTALGSVAIAFENQQTPDILMAGILNEALVNGNTTCA